MDSIATDSKTAGRAQAKAERTLRQQAAETSRLLDLLGNESRLLILCYLMMQKEMKVGELVKAVKLSQSALSQHLLKLRENGLVEFRRESQTLYYRIADPRVGKLIKVLKKLYCEDL